MIPRVISGHWAAFFMRCVLLYLHSELTTCKASTKKSSKESTLVFQNTSVKKWPPSSSSCSKYHRVTDQLVIRFCLFLLLSHWSRSFSLRMVTPLLEHLLTTSMKPYLRQSGWARTFSLWLSVCPKQSIALQKLENFQVEFFFKTIAIRSQSRRSIQYNKPVVTISFSSRNLTRTSRSHVCRSILISRTKVTLIITVTTRRMEMVPTMRTHWTHMLELRHWNRRAAKQKLATLTTKVMNKRGSICGSQAVVEIPATRICQVIITKWQALTTGRLTLITSQGKRAPWRWSTVLQ